MAKAMVKPPPSKPKAKVDVQVKKLQQASFDDPTLNVTSKKVAMVQSRPKSKPAPLHPPAPAVEITPSVIKKVADLLRAAGFDRAFTVLEARSNMYVVHLEGEYNNRVITLIGDKPVI